MGWIVEKKVGWVVLVVSTKLSNHFSISGVLKTHNCGRTKGTPHRGEVTSLISHRYRGLNTSEEIQSNAKSKCGAEKLKLVCVGREKQKQTGLDLESQETAPDRMCRRRNIPTQQRSSTCAVI